MAVTKVWTEARGKVGTEGKCRVCGRSPSEHPGLVFRLEAAHTVGEDYQDETRFSFDPAFAEDEGLSIELVKAASVVPLCIDEAGGCLSRYESGELDLLPYLTVEEQLDAVAAVGMQSAYATITGTGKAKV